MPTVPTKDQTLLVIDAGLFTHVAESLARDFKRTMYWSDPVRSGFPQEKHSRIGCDLPGIERIQDVWGALSEGDIDLVAFPDVVTASLASYVKSLGIPVFGTSKHAAELELDRWGTRKVLKSIGLAVPEATRIVGTEDLEKYLRQTSDVYVKYGRYRGDLETFHHDDWFTTESWFHDTVRHLGPSGPEAEFIVEEPIKGVEAGIDAYSVDGEWPERVMWGYELKDAGYLGRVDAYDRVPAPLRLVADRLSSVLKDRGHRGWISTECRIDRDAVAYLIDPCLRCGSPPSEAWSLLCENQGEIVSEGARGRIVAPEVRGKYAAELILKSEFAADHFLALEIPANVRERIQLHNHCVIDGKDYTVPIQIPEIGAAVGYGDSIDEAAEQALEAADALKAYELDYREDAFDEIKKEIEKGRSCGLEWE